MATCGGAVVTKSGGRGWSLKKKECEAAEELVAIAREKRRITRPKGAKDVLEVSNEYKMKPWRSQTKQGSQSSTDAELLTRRIRCDVPESQKLLLFFFVEN